MICRETDVVIGCLSGRPPALAERLDSAFLNDDFALPTIVLFELQCGLAKSARAQDNAERLATFLELPIPVLPFEPDDAHEAGDIRAALQTRQDTERTLRYPDCGSGTPAWRDAGDRQPPRVRPRPRLTTGLSREACFYSAALATPATRVRVR